MDISGARQLFEIPDEVSYFNCASLSPQLINVTNTGIHHLQKKTSPWEIHPADWFSGAEELRTQAAKIINTDANSIAIIPAVSYGISIAAANIPVSKGQQIIVMDEEYPSNYYAWKELAIKNMAELVTVIKGDTNWTTALLNAIGEKTAIVAVSNCHWTNGAMVDLVKIGEKVRSFGAAMVIDASQAMGAHPIDIQVIQPDFLMAVGYKWLLGPYALGYLYASEKWQKKGRPIEYSWLTKQGSEDFANLVKYRDDFRDGARRFDMGEFPSFINVPMATAALKQINEWGVPMIKKALSKFTAEIASQATEIGLKIPETNERADHMIGIDLPDNIPGSLKGELQSQKIFVGFRGKSIRVSPYLYNTKNDIDRLMKVIRKYA